MLNFAAPPLVKNGVLTAATKIVGHHFVASPKDTSESSYLQSFLTSRAHSSWIEHMVLKALHLDSVSVDMNVQLCFDPKSKCDTFCGFRASFWFTCGLVYVFFVF